MLLRPTLLIPLLIGAITRAAHAQSATTSGLTPSPSPSPSPSPGLVTGSLEGSGLAAEPLAAARQSGPALTDAPDSATAASRVTARLHGPLDKLYDQHPWLPRLLGAQFTYIGQRLFPFRAKYNGRLSITDAGDYQGTHTYGVYLGARLTGRLQAYVDFEMARGAGVSQATGLAGLTNGDVIRQGSVELGQGPYLARSYLRYFLPIGRTVDTAERGQDQLPGPESTTRIDFKLGKIALTDDFDVNRYANSTRYQFENWGLWNNPSWDFAANTRGYTNAVVAGYVSPRWALKVAAAQMPLFANGNTLDDDLSRAHGLDAELTLRTLGSGTAIRLLAYDNEGRMGIYRDAITFAQAHHTRPDIAANDRKGRTKYGFGLNVEQPIADSGNTGLFARLGWNDGKTEDFAFTESDRTVSAGLQLAANAWHRPQDRLGAAILIDGLSPDHRDYLAAGGTGFLLGDGRLNYATEDIAEIYYRLAIPGLAFCQLSPDYQFVLHPGYNRDRGPAHIIGFRVNLHY